MTTRSATYLPSTVNLHLVAHCNMKCGYCYARFEQERQQPRLAPEVLVAILRDLHGQGVRRVTFAGGEPTLHRDLATLLRAASEVGLVTSVVTNASRIDETWLADHGPHLRWLALSVDSIDEATTHELGRRATSMARGHVAQVRAVAAQVHRWNALRPPARRLRLKLNITVTNRNAHEDPSDLIRAVRPEKVKLFQMLLVEGENDDAAALVCAPDAYAAYVTRARAGAPEGVAVVTEDNDAMDGSYAMVDPLGRFYQRVAGRYVRSRPIPEVGVMAAWSDVGGFDRARFLDRGGEYAPGEVATGNLPLLIAIEGLDGSGKSTVARALAERMDAALLTNPDKASAAERAAADRAEPAERRAWYLAANREVAAVAERHRAAGRAVVMDRSVASTLAFAAAEQDGPIAAWPAEIPRPDLLVLLTLAEPVRRGRLADRGAATTEEERLAGDHAFRSRVLDGYRSLGAIEVDADRAVDAVVARIEKLIEHLG
jgi:radical S-adenosyl methionine domain-containing protein 2